MIMKTKKDKSEIEAAAVTFMAALLPDYPESLALCAKQAVKCAFLIFNELEKVEIGTTKRSDGLEVDIFEEGGATYDEFRGASYDERKTR